MAGSLVKALKAFGSNERPLTAAQLKVHLRQLTGKNDRLVAVIGGSLIEFNLERLLITAMPRVKKQRTKTTEKKDGSVSFEYGWNALHESLFGARGALSTFSAKILACYALGLIDDEIRHNADYVREIRNVFAHKIAPVSFRTKQVADVCRLLKFGPSAKRQESKNMRLRYISAVVNTGSSLAAHSTSLEPTSLQNASPVRPASLR